MGEYGSLTALKRFQRETAPGTAVPDLLRGEADSPTGAQKGGQAADNGRFARAGAPLEQDSRRHRVLRIRSLLRVPGALVGVLGQMGCSRAWPVLAALFRVEPRV
ncbi:hypothetical protein GCM10022206_24660 [Streptomyces chiangmaiensis]